MYKRIASLLTALAALLLLAVPSWSTWAPE